MLNIGFKKEELNKLDNAHKKYEKSAEDVSELSIYLMKQRRETAENLIPEIESYINSIANTPKELNKSVSEYKASFSTFNGIIDKLQKESINTDIKTGAGAGVSVATGAAVAAFAPTAAMAAATTFGVASTGTAISALSGAAATNAALAWLGGGALTAGGGGMVAGKAMLAMAGPVGWAVGGILLAGTGVLSYKKNKQIAEEAMAKRKQIETYDKALQAALVEIRSLIRLTREHALGVRNILSELKSSPIQNYTSFNGAQKDKIGSLVNHINSLSELLNKKVDA